MKDIIAFTIEITYAKKTSDTTIFAPKNVRPVSYVACAISVTFDEFLANAIEIAHVTYFQRNTNRASLRPICLFFNFLWKNPSCKLYE